MVSKNDSVQLLQEFIQLSKKMEVSVTCFF